MRFRLPGWSQKFPEVGSISEGGHSANGCAPRCRPSERFEALAADWAVASRIDRNGYASLTDFCGTSLSP